MKAKLFFLGVVACAFVTVAHATHFDTGWIEFRQPNGVTFIGRMWGDEWSYTFLTKEGYRFDKNFTDRCYYAPSQRDGVYQLSDLRVGIDASTALPKGLSACIPRPAGLRENSSNISLTETQYYFPLQVGNEWIYYFAESGVIDTTPSIFYFVFDTVSFDRKKYFAYGENLNYPEYYRPDSLGHIFRYIDGNEILWFDFTKAVGDSYQIDLPSLNQHYHVRVLERNAIVENRAGRFENCIRLFFDDPHQVDDAFELWFAENVGIVKRFLPHAVIEQLCSAKVDGKIYPQTSVKSTNDDEILAKQSLLFQNYPNPFNENTVIRYSLLSVSQKVQLKIYDIYGEEVITLVDEMQSKGDHAVLWSGLNSDGIAVATGIYLCKLQVGHFHLVMKLVVLR
jgi:hypothetical protein